MFIIFNQIDSIPKLPQNNTLSYPTYLLLKAYLICYFFLFWYHDYFLALLITTSRLLRVKSSLLYSESKGHCCEIRLCVIAQGKNF